MGKNTLKIMFSGKQGSGKSSTALSCGHLGEMIYGLKWVRLRFAEPLYQIHDAALPVLKKLGIVPEHVDKEGDFLQVIGTEYGRNKKGPDTWVKIVRKQIEELEAQDNTLLTIEDCRFQDEFEAFPDFLRVRLEADEAIRKARAHAWREGTNHPSEIDLDGYATQGKFELYADTGTTPMTDVVMACLLEARRKSGSYPATGLTGGHPAIAQTPAGLTQAPGATACHDCKHGNSLVCGALQEGLQGSELLLMTAGKKCSCPVCHGGAK